ncbi:ubiquitin-conjugating enzyme E2-binding protein [Podospora australis]|uniref:Ubiquitin-conjugating enzyme E2-binding protein n=1 Tax=Podospora australis TaxID=1536484 RepID=A0AAN6WZX3_9PEZI|nr:ubiquitin-conjugating enzyme E2-binding protein [Podospora australis]
MAGSSLYAELLANIRQISLAASLSSPSDASTKVSVGADGCTIELNHHGGIRKLILPAKVALGGTLLPVDPRQQGSVTLSWRLPLNPSVASQLQAQRNDEAIWSATDFEAGSTVTCRQCDAAVVNAGEIRVWKDLPSENWAEMMEFWHCHKPDHKHDHDHKEDQSGKADNRSLEARGYGASSIISAQESVGFVDLTNLLVHETNCENITFSRSDFKHSSPNREDHEPEASDASGSKHRSLNAFCSSCHTQLGFFVFRTAAVTLFKWQISVKPNRSSASPDVAQCLSATIISTIARSASSKSLIVPIEETTTTVETKLAQPVIYAWVLNNNIIYSSSSSRTSTKAIKLLYKLVSQEDADKMLEAVTCEAQELNLPAQAIETIVQQLDRSNLLLPTTERIFKGEWKVGLLTR